MPYHPRIETDLYVNQITTRSRNSELWFIHNKKLEEVILSNVAKYQARYEVDLYALAIHGNHIHLEAAFRKQNRAAFMRDLNASIARAVKRHCKKYPGGNFWGRRYSNEFLGLNSDVEDKFFYTVLQAVQDGLSQTIEGYGGYNCFHSATHGIERVYKSINWNEYNEARRFGKNVHIKDFEEKHKLIFKRLPGYEELTQKEYVKVMQEKLEQRRAKAIEVRLNKDLGFASKESLKKTKPGDRPVNTKTSERNSHRPRVISKCRDTRKEMETWYFHMYFEFKECSLRYREGDTDIDFPEGMYRPPTYH